MIWLQIIAFCFAIICAWANKRPVRRMIDYGASRYEEEELHFINAASKIIFTSVGTVVIAMCSDRSVLQYLLTIPLLSLWQWLVFDIALNKLLGHRWDYIGTTAKLDQWLNFHFPHAGRLKALVCLTAIVMLNIALS